MRIPRAKWAPIVRPFANLLIPQEERHLMNSDGSAKA
jgi:hypothetical protein